MKTLKLAIYESPDKWKHRQIYTEAEGKFSTYARASEWVEVTFPELTDEEVIPEKLRLLKHEIARIRLDAQERIDSKEKHIAELSAITFTGRTLTADDVMTSTAELREAMGL